ncbi:hypothetical protein [Sphingomonas morindae]|uniref:Lipoprotein n=1 Tax=Sphingomonas morindae TaxID=1541170 RepID=A0ABY4X690_9SPHN|nr:hypothetical protein [Sphingomonas morindae]USI72415.1 hypothetical protein LHA26_14115 [Sphingomonas morindae]
MRFCVTIVTVAVLLSGCVAKTAYHVATLPVRAGAKVVDWTTTSQSEADRNRGRKMRKEEAREKREARRRAEAG